MNTPVKASSVNKLYKIACSGYADKGSGSLAGANFLVLEELLQRGFEIDFYGWRGFNEPRELLEYKNFRFISVPEDSQLKSWLESLPKVLREIISPLIYQLFIIPSNYRRMQQSILEKHHTEQYELLLFLGLPSPFRVQNIPVISWLQGSTQSEWLFIQKLKNIIIPLCGLSLYIKLMFFYSIKGRRIRIERQNSDFLICGSQWSKDQLISEGVKPESLRVLPYPVNLDFFKLTSPGSEQKQNRRKVFLWLGRCDPRKRLDLLLKAYALVLQERQDVQLKIFGAIRYAQGYKKLIDQFEFPDYLEYQPIIERSNVPGLMAQSHILVQPSEGENFGSSVAEALCAGLPVIVGPTNGTKDYINPSSFVFEEYTPESLKKVMLEALQVVEENQEKLALEARNTAEKNFSVENIVDCLQDIFQEALMLDQPRTMHQAAFTSSIFKE